MVPRATRELLRRSLDSNLLFAENTVTLAATNLKGDVQLQTNSKALQKFQAPGYSQPRGGKRVTQIPFVQQRGNKNPVLTNLRVLIVIPNQALGEA